MSIRLREVAQERGLDISKISRRADLNYKTVFQLWHDPHRDVTLHTLEKMAKALGVRVTDLLDESK
jgi:DNA-binding Xre family transcriptional regulator